MLAYGLQTFIYCKTAKIASFEDLVFINIKISPKTLATIIFFIQDVFYKDVFVCKISF